MYVFCHDFIPFPENLRALPHLISYTIYHDLLKWCDKLYYHIQNHDYKCVFCHATPALNIVPPPGRRTSFGEFPTWRLAGHQLGLAGDLQAGDQRAWAVWLAV